MPTLTVWALRIALSYLGIGFTLVALMLAARGGNGPSSLLSLRPLHAEILLIGWTVQLAFAVAYWILPRTPGGGRASPPLAWAALLLLNAGVLMVGIGAVLDLPRSILIAGRWAELLAALAFAVHAWPRARAYSARNPLP